MNKKILVRKQIEVIAHNLTQLGEGKPQVRIVMGGEAKQMSELKAGTPDKLRQKINKRFQDMRVRKQVVLTHLFLHL